MKNRKLLFIVLLLSTIAVHFAFFGQPNETVFDEVHFGKFVSAYYTHSYYFDIHPPGGKLIIAGFARLFNFTPEYSFAQIGQPFPDHKYLVLRFLPLLAGTLLPIIIYLLALELGFSDMGAFGAGMFIVLENALVTQSRYILLDPFLLVFGFSAVLFYFRWRRTSKMPNLVGMAIMGGLSMSIKWTGMAFLGLTGIVELIDIIQAVSFKHIARLVIFFIAIPLAIYFSFFAIHFAILSKTGDGDAFMTQAFQSSLVGSTYANDPSLKPLNVFQKFIELNKEMYHANQTLTATHPYSSKWYTWPFMIRPVYYWNHASTTTPTESKIYLLGNPLIWWASTVAILYLLFSSIGSNFFKNRTVLILLGGYIINYLPFIGIGRVMFLYHYLSALIFAVLALAYLIDQQKFSKRIFLAAIGIAAIAFVYFAPLTYGLPLEAGQFQNRVWLTTWQ